METLASPSLDLASERAPGRALPRQKTVTLDPREGTEDLGESPVDLQELAARQGWADSPKPGLRRAPQSRKTQSHQTQSRGPLPVSRTTRDQPGERTRRTSVPRRTLPVLGRSLTATGKVLSQAAATARRAEALQVALAERPQAEGTPRRRASRSEAVSFLFFAGLIATTFLV